MPGRCQSSRTALSGDATRPCLHPWRRIAGLAPPVAMRFDSVATHGVLLRAISPNERHRRARPNPARAPETSPAPPGAAGRGGRSGASVNSEQPRMLVRHVTLRHFDVSHAENDAGAGGIWKVWRQRKRNAILLSMRISGNIRFRRFHGAVRQETEITTANDCKVCRRLAGRGREVLVLV